MRIIGIKLTILLILTMLVSACGGNEPRYRIGVSQCSEDIWRNKQNSELRMGACCHEGVELRFAAADDNDERQVQQIDSLVATGLDLLIVAPNQMTTVSPAIDRAYDSGLPVIVFERKTNSQKYTAYMGADNYEMGQLLGEYIATQLGGRGRVLEIKGLEGSSSAIDRHEGFLAALARYPGITVVATLAGDWTEESAYRAVTAYGGDLADVDYVFGGNDRMAMGARRAMADTGRLSPRTLFCGVDGLPGENGGIRLVRDSILDATYIYPTHGDKLLQLAVDILDGKPYEKENKLMSALVTADNANVLLMQAEEISRQAAYLDQLHNQASLWREKLSYQRMLTLMACCVIALLLIIGVGVYLYYLQRAKIATEREQLAQSRLDFYARVSHELRTPLTLVEGPLDQLAETPELLAASKPTADMLAIVRRNAGQLSVLVNQILDAQLRVKTEGMTSEQIDELTLLQAFDQPDQSAQSDLSDLSDSSDSSDRSDSSAEFPSLLIVDDNADIRAYLRTILAGRYQVSEAADGRQGLDRAREEVPDLIVSDVMMPVMDGLEFCKRVKDDEATSHIPVILLTARAMPSTRIEGYESGADAYITKPFSPRLLLARVDNLLRSRRQLRNLFAAAPAAPAESPGDKKGQESHASQDAAAAPALSAQDRRFIDRFKAVVEARMAESELSVEDISADVGMSRVQLYRKVKALTGLSPNEQLRKARLARAHALLADGAGSVSEIAYQVGFATPSYFSKCFKEEFGHSPNEL